MAIAHLSQKKADSLLVMEKEAVNDREINLPYPAGKCDFDFLSQDKREKFVLNYTKHSLNLAKRNHHLRTSVIGLARLDVNGPPHMNPDGQRIESNHLHLYHEGCDLNWAIELSRKHFTNLDNPYQTLEDFMRYCKVFELPNIRKGLFT